MKPEILERQIAHADYLTVERLRMRLSDGAEVSREVERHGDAAAVLPYDVERRGCGMQGKQRLPWRVRMPERFLPPGRFALLLFFSASLQKMRSS
jgi:hypothetical protein